MFEEFKTDLEIMEFLKNKIESIGSLNECRLYREEEYVKLDQEIIKFKNCIEWIIRANVLINNIKFSLLEALNYSYDFINPFEESIKKQKYSYYFENAVYREGILWDILKQFLNERYVGGNKRTDNISIFKLLKELNFSEKEKKEILKYLNSKDHREIRDELRNLLTHSIDPMSMMVFHDLKNGKFKPTINLNFIKHPFENIYNLLKDFEILLKFYKIQIKKMEEDLKEKYALYKVLYLAKCGEKCEFEEFITKERIEEIEKFIYLECDEKCTEKIFQENKEVCKPIKIEYSRMGIEESYIRNIV